MEIRTRNTNTLMLDVIARLQKDGVKNASRNGPVIRFPEPVTIQITNPWERVNFNPVRDCNPFFHLVESVAMLGAYNSAPYLAYFAKTMLNYSDDGMTFNAFYGSRMRHYQTKRQMVPAECSPDPQDQLAEVVDILSKDPDSRQAVITLWDPADLMFHRTKDKACNLILIFSIVDGKVRMSSYNRSNDAIWGGVMGANIVHLSFFQEYVACALKLPMGDWWHTSNNLHTYVENPKWVDLCGWGSSSDDVMDAYPNIPAASLVKLFGNTSAQDETVDPFEHDTSRFLALTSDAIKDQQTDTEKAILIGPTFFSKFYRDVMTPVFNAWQHYKADHLDEALVAASNIVSPDWRIACVEWLDRRVSQRQLKKNNAT